MNLSRPVHYWQKTKWRKILFMLVWFKENKYFVQVNCGRGGWWIESASFEKVEETILSAIDRNGGFIARNALIRQLAMPVGVCENMIQVTLQLLL